MSEPNPSSKAHRFGFVAVAGRPNAGKSTLFNALIGEKVAITAHQAQTTRTSVQGVLTTPSAQIVFSDTPGIHKSDTLFNRFMMGSVRDALDSPDLVLFVADALHSPVAEDEHAVHSLKNASAAILVLNKIDRVRDKRDLLPLIETYLAWFPFVEAIPVSARTGEGLDRLSAALRARLPEGPALFPNDYLTDQPMRFLAGELIREQVLRITHDEVPHAVAVLVDSWEEREWRGNKPALTRVAATIYVERPGQKAILVGAAGQVLKKVGSQARLELERRLGHKVFLSLFVKVKPNWREDPSFLRVVDWRSMAGAPDKMAVDVPAEDPNSR